MDRGRATSSRHLLRQGLPAPATWALLWNNPKLHTPERRKTWLACDEHRTSRSGALPRRGARLPVKDGRAVCARRDHDRGPLRLLAADGRHRPVGLEERQVVDPWPGQLAAPSRPPSGRRAPRRRRPRAWRRTQVGLVAGEEAVADLAVGGEPDPVAVAAERAGHRGDDADRRRAAVDGEQLGRGTPPRLPCRGQVELGARARSKISSAVIISSRLQPCWASSGICSMKRSS